LLQLSLCPRQLVRAEDGEGLVCVIGWVLRAAGASSLTVHSGREWQE
jgi:hypothetical protein